MLLWIRLAAQAASTGEENLPQIGDHSLRILSSNVLELILINTKAPDPAGVTDWDLVNGSFQFQAPSPTSFAVTVDGQAATIQSAIGFKRRPLYAPYADRDLRIQNCLYLQLSQPISDNQVVEVKNPSHSLWAAGVQYLAAADPLRYSPAIHVNQEGYVPSLPKKVTPFCSMCVSCTPPG